MLYPHEALIEAAGYPALVRFDPVRSRYPLVVFMTGGGVLGRIAYGPPEGRASDFLCHWLRAEGFASLALSYPLDMAAVFATTFPNFTISDWAEQSAEIIARHIDLHGLPDSVVVLGWSMAGRIAEPLHAALQRRGKTVGLFIAMAGASALPNTLPGLNQLKPAASGLASLQGVFLNWLLQSVADMNRFTGRTVLDPNLFAGEMTGDFPIALAASGMRLRNGTFVPDAAGDALEIGAARYRSFPPLALMTHDSPTDARHALLDRSSWGLYITQQICETLVFSRAERLAALSPGNWSALREQVRNAALNLSVTLPGNHMFFLGEGGARRAAQTVTQLLRTTASLRDAIGRFLD